MAVVRTSWRVIGIQHGVTGRSSRAVIVVVIVIYVGFPPVTVNIDTRQCFGLGSDHVIVIGGDQRRHEVPVNSKGRVISVKRS